MKIWSLTDTGKPCRIFYKLLKLGRLKDLTEVYDFDHDCVVMTGILVYR